jgi:signal transduction histidine kinase
MLLLPRRRTDPFFMPPTRTASRSPSPPIAAVYAVAIVIIVGIGDYLTGYEISFSIFYLLAIAMAVWFVGRGFAVLIAILSVAAWYVADFAAGAPFSNRFALFWNGTIALAFYLIAIALLSLAKASQESLEARVRQRTVELTDEMAGRERLEKEILAVSERERRLIGHDLHDSLCQHLTGTALAGQVLGENLAAKSLPEAGGAYRVVELIEEGITLARNLARGLSPFQLEADGLPATLETLAAATSDQFGITCRFVCEIPPAIHDIATATHLYRIAQEAISNAVRHGKARSIAITLGMIGDDIELRIEDDGIGVAEPLPRQDGMGLRIMQHRATMIGGSFHIARMARGTVVTCTFRNPETTT